MSCVCQTGSRIVLCRVTVPCEDAKMCHEGTSVGLPKSIGKGTVSLEDLTTPMRFSR